MTPAEFKCALCKAKITVMELAVASRYSQGYITQILNGKENAPKGTMDILIEAFERLTGELAR